MNRKTKARLHSIYQKFRPAMVQALQNSRFKISREEVGKISNNEIKYDKPESYALSEPRGSGPLPAQLDNACHKFQLPKPSVHELQDITLTGPDAIPVASYHRYVLPEFAGNTRELINSMVKSLYYGSIPARLPTSVSHQHPTLSLAGRGGRAYFHWFADYLPRLQAAEAYAELTGKFPIILIPSNPPCFVERSIDYMNIPEEHITEWDLNRTRVKSLLLPSSRQDSPEGLCCSRYSPRALQWVGKRIKSNVEYNANEPEHERLFLTRRGASTRRIVNEDEVLGILSEFDFEPVNLSKKSLEDQVQLFHNAKYVVSPHGAGLTNMIYAEDMNVLEMFGEEVVPLYYILSECFSFNYQYFRVSDTQPSENRIRGTDFIIDIDVFRDALNNML